MENELLPCPFCGGEGELCTYYGGGEHNETVHTAMCSNDDCPMNVLTPDYLTEAEAIAAWNTRAERTCEFADDSDGEPSPPKCSACGYDPGIYECAWYEDGTYGYERNYCPNCGAKVIGD